MYVKKRKKKKKRKIGKPENRKMRQGNKEKCYYRERLRLFFMGIS